MIVMGGIVGSGIFINPYVVARQVHTPVLILGAWLAGGIVALAGAFIYAELAARRPEVGGQYAYLREAFHPSVAFLYGWTLLLVTQTGGMAAVAVTFSRYFLEITHAPMTDWAVAVAVDARQLPGRPRGQQRAKWIDGLENPGNRGAGRVWISLRWRFARAMDAVVRSTCVPWACREHGRGDDAGDVRIRRLADGKLCRW
jgi:hypothetical protein